MIKSHGHNVTSASEGQLKVTLSSTRGIGETLIVGNVECGEFHLRNKDLEKAMIEMWQRRVEIYLTMAVSAAFRNLTGFYKDREKVVKEWGEVSFENAENVYKKFDEHLGQNQYFAGEKFSIADITGLCTIDFAKFIELEIKDNQKNLARWYEEISSRPSAQA